MNQIVPPRFLFRWSFTARKLDKLPHSSGRLLDLPADCALTSLSELDQRKDFAVVSLAWNNHGLAVSVNVSGRSRRPICDANELSASDGLHLWIDTRNTQTVHRATRFCHAFILLPAGAGKKKLDPVIRAVPIARARDDASLPSVDAVQLQSEISPTGYWIDAWFPAEVFTGYDPATNPRIGFHYVVRDNDQGDQTLAVGSEFPFESDPSLWQTVELNS